VNSAQLYKKGPSTQSIPVLISGLKLEQPNSFSTESWTTTRGLGVILLWIGITPGESGELSTWQG